MAGTAYGYITGSQLLDVSSIESFKISHLFALALVGMIVVIVECAINQLRFTWAKLTNFSVTLTCPASDVTHKRIDSVIVLFVSCYWM